MPHEVLCAALFDGTNLHQGMILHLSQGRIADLRPHQGGGRPDAGLIVPGFIDLQVNGAGGVAVDGQLTLPALARMCDALAGLGTTGCLPTLVTDSPDATQAVLAVAEAAAQARLPGFLGLHLEGPHLDPRRHGAHDPALIRAMTDADLALLCRMAPRLPALMVTLAPEAVTPPQITALTRAGVIVSLGHSDCTADAANAAFAAGARGVTHLFNAMSPLTHRAPGLVGAALAGTATCGLIVDGHHVDPIALRIALAARPDGLHLVSDCFSVAGTAAQSFTLGGRAIRRQAGRLTLADGTLAGADLTMAEAVQRVQTLAGASLPRALAMATSGPAQVLGRSDIGHLRPGAAADLVHLGPDGQVLQVWRAGVPLL